MFLPVIVPLCSSGLVERDLLKADCTPVMAIGATRKTAVWDPPSAIVSLCSSVVCEMSFHHTA